MDKRAVKSTHDMKSSKEKFPIVGIGASAGGLEAFTTLLQNLPNNTGMAFVLIQHLDPTHESKLGEILQRISTMPITEVANNTKVKPNHVYVIPPNASMKITEGVLKLFPRKKSQGNYMVVDYFLRSLAQDQEEKAISVILSGNGIDGTLGLIEVKARGGITFAQDEKTATYTGMPHSAIANGQVDFVLPIEAISQELIRISKIGTKKHFASDFSDEGDNDLNTVFGILRKNTGVDFTYYKHNTIRRRIQRRMALHKIITLEEYVSYLQKNAAEIEELYNDILICVTNFFRDPAIFDYLKKEVFPQLIQHRSSTRTPIRIWVPGCATGEEVYSLAICLIESLGSMISKIPLQLFGTDVSDESIEKARAGLYLENIAMDVSSERLENFFTKVNGHYQINQSIREMCVFAKQNVFTDPPFSRLDLISCRNLLIYLEPVLQKRVIPIFHYSLNSDGYLLLGSSESVGEFSDMFTSENKKYKLYAKTNVSTKMRFDFHNSKQLLEKGKGLLEKKLMLPENEMSQVLTIQKEADRIILNKYAPAGVVVNSNYDIIQFRGHTSAYLEPSPGKASLNLLKMAREGLFLELSSALKDAKALGHAIKRKGLHNEKNGESLVVDIEVAPLHSEVSREPLFLVLFKEIEVLENQSFSSNQPNTSHISEKTKEVQIHKLKQELSATRAHLQSTIEELEESNERLQVANEEILSNNEELQSVNEELETSKEELQSTNEELTTVNEEIQNRNVEITQANNDLNNLLESVNIPIIMLDKQLRIRRFTPGAERVMNLIPSDIGRPIGNIRPMIVLQDLEDLILDTLHTGDTIEREVQDKHGNWYLMKLLAYKVADNEINGIIMTFVDIGVIKKVQQANVELAVIVASSEDAIIGKTLDGDITAWNYGATKMFGYSQEEVIGKSIDLLIPPELRKEETEIRAKI